MPDEAAVLGARVLVVAPYGQDAISLADLLKRGGLKAAGLPTLDAAAAGLDDTAGAVILTQEALGTPLKTFADALSAQAAWSDIPLILLTVRQTHATPPINFATLPFPATNVVMLERPVSGLSLLTAVTSALRSRHRQFMLRDRIDQLESSQAALTASERELRSVADALPTLIGLVDRDHRYRFANKAYQAWFGLAPEDVVGRTIGEVIGDDRYAARRRHMDRALMGEDVRLELPWPHPDGRRRDAEIRYIPRRNNDGEIDAFHVFVVDVTDRNLNAEELEAQVQARTEALNLEMEGRLRAEEALRHSQKLEAVGQLTGGVAHDFNNLLTIISSSVDYLAKDNLPEARRKRYIQAIAETTGRAAKLTGQLLAFARRQPLKPEVFDVVERVQSVIDLVRPLVGGRIEIQGRWPLAETAALWVEADVSQFETALVNLAVNARDAMDGEGVLRFCVSAVTGLPAIRGHAAAEGDFVLVEVVDTGCGVPAARLEAIFEPFYTTKEVGRGTGLGLSQVFGFVKQSGGDIEVRSDVGQGAAFRIYLPKTTARPPTQEAPPLKGHSGRLLCVLVVEDNVGVGQFATEMLGDLGHGSVWVGNAELALSELAVDAGRFDVVFSDVVMPGMNGVDLARTIQTRYPGLPVVLTSGYSQTLAEDSSHGFQLLRKPYSVDALADILFQASERHPS